MKISWQLLSRFLDTSEIDPYEAAERFGLNVAEIEGVETIGRDHDKIVAAKIETVASVPGAKKLSLCQVSYQGQLLDVVCGAPNVRPGLIGVYAPVGTTMDNGMTLSARKMMGVVSNGMLLAEDELGVSGDHDEIIELLDVEPGALIAPLFQTKDVLWEVDNKSLTHRPDLWGHYGIAREVAVIFAKKMRPMVTSPLNFTTGDPLQVEVLDFERCPRYSAFMMTGVQVGPSPIAMRGLLHRLGVRPINNIVDAGNYVMLVSGNPVHAFDARKLAGNRITVRTARAGEELQTLDDTAYTLRAERDLVIADAQGPVALAGIMGGAESGVCADTAELVLETANFVAVGVRLTAAATKIHTDSSLRYEKSLDPELVTAAATLFGQVVAELAPGAKVCSRYYDLRTPAAAPILIDFSCDYIRERLGQDLTDDYMLNILRQLGFVITASTGGCHQALVPSYRATKDISIPEDLVEEVGRHFGYNNITPVQPRAQLVPPVRTAQNRLVKGLKQVLVRSLGYSEVMLYPFEQERMLGVVDKPLASYVRVENPISSELPVLKNSLIPGLLDSIEQNLRNYDSYKIFETNRAYATVYQDGIPVQPLRLGLLMVAKNQDSNFFYKLKGELEFLFAELGLPQLEVRKSQGDDQLWHPYRAGDIYCDDCCLGPVGEIHPRILSKLNVTAGVLAAELDLEALAGITRQVHLHQVQPRFPAVCWDLSLVVDQGCQVGDVLSSIDATKTPGLQVVSFVCAYNGDQIPEGKKCLSFSLRFADPERTMTEREVDILFGQVVSHLKADLGGSLRA